MQSETESFLLSRPGDSRNQSRIEGDADTSTTTQETSTRVPGETFITAHLEPYMTETVTHGHTIGPIEQTLTALRIDNDELLIAAGGEDGIVRLYMSDQHKYFGQVVFTEEPGNAVLDLKWRPTRDPNLTEHVFIASDVFGNIYHVHATSKKILHKMREEGNQAYALDYNFDGSKFATAGKDCHVRVYDEHKKTNVSVLTASPDIPIHANRILSLKFSPEDPNLLLTGSWDESLKIWDLRAGHVVKSIYGMKVYGDGLDILNNVILAGHSRDKNQLQLWDLGTQKLIENIAWDPNPSPNQPYEDASITVARFSKHTPNYIVAFAGILKQLRVFDRRNGNRLCNVTNTAGEVNSAEFFGSSDTFVYGGLCGALLTCKIGQ